MAGSTDTCAQILKRTAQVLHLSLDDLSELGNPSVEATEALQRLDAYTKLLDRQGNSSGSQQAFGRPFEYLAEVLLSGLQAVLLHLLSAVDDYATAS